MIWDDLGIPETSRTESVYDDGATCGETVFPGRTVALAEIGNRVTVNWRGESER